MTIAEKIVNVRLSAGLSEKEFAKKLSVSETELKEYESGEIVPPDDLRIKISTEFSLPAFELCLDEQEQQKLNEQTEPTPDQRLPYNPYAQQNVFVQRPTAISKDKLFKSAAMKIAVYPSLFMIPVVFAFSIAFVLLSSFLKTSEQNLSSFPDNSVTFLQSIILSICTILFLYLVCKKQFTKSFKLLNKYENLISLFPVFLTSISAFSYITNSVFNNLYSIFGELLNIQNSFNLTADENYFSAVSSVLFSLVTAIITIFAEYFFIIKLFKLFDLSDQDNSERQYSKKIFVFFAASSAGILILKVISFIIVPITANEIIFNLIYFVLNTLICVVWYMLYIKPECKNDKLYIKALPYFILLAPTALSICSSIVSFIISLVR